jgi:tetratricopeptide (TPR) repeat protein
MRYQQGDEMDYSCYQCRERFRPDRLLVDFRDRMDAFIEGGKSEVSDDIVRIFRELVEVAWQDGILTDEERTKLEFFRNHFNIPDYLFRNIEDNVKREMGLQLDEIDLRIVRRYESVIKNSILKGRITAKLREFIEGYRLEWNIPQDYARKLESRIWYEEGLHFLERGNSAKAYTCFFNSHLLDETNRLALEKVQLLSPERRLKADVMDTIQLLKPESVSVRHQETVIPKEFETASIQVRKTRLMDEPPDTIILESPKERIVKEPMVKVMEPIYTPSGRSKKILKATKPSRDEKQESYYTTQDMTEEEVYAEQYPEYAEGEVDANAPVYEEDAGYDQEEEYSEYPAEEAVEEEISGEEESEEVYEEIPQEEIEETAEAEEVPEIPDTEDEASVEEALEEEPAEEFMEIPVSEDAEDTEEDMEASLEEVEEEISGEPEPEETSLPMESAETEEIEEQEETGADTEPLEPVKIAEPEKVKEPEPEEVPTPETVHPVEHETAIPGVKEPEKVEKPVEPAISEPVVEVKPEAAAAVAVKEKRGKKTSPAVVVAEPTPVIEAAEVEVKAAVVPDAPDTGDLRESLDDIMAASDRGKKKAGLLEILPTFEIPSIEEEISKIEDEEGEKISIVDEWKGKAASSAAVKESAGIELDAVKSPDVTPSMEDFNVEVPAVDLSDEELSEEETEEIEEAISKVQEPVVVVTPAVIEEEEESPQTTDLAKPSIFHRDTGSKKHPSGKTISQLLADAKSNIQADNFSVARRICDQILEVDPENLVGKLLRGKCAIEEEDYEVAYRDLSSVLSVKAEDPTLLLLHGKAALEVGDLKSALKDLREVTDKLPGNPEGWLLRGNVLLEMGKFQNAIRDFTRSIKLNPDETEAYLNRGNAFIELREFEKAIQDYDRAIEIDNEDSYLYFQRGNAYFLMKEFDLALRDFNLAIKTDPDDNDYYVNRGITFARLDRDELALRDFNRVIENSGDITMAVSRRGQLHLEMERYKEALADFNKVIKDLPNEPEGYVLRSRTYLEMSELKKALNDAEKAISIDPENIHALTVLGNIYLARDLFDDAIEAYSRALFIEPDLAEACLNRGLANEKRGDLEAARQDFVRYLQINRIDSSTL